MLKAKSIAMSNGINRKNHYFSLNLILNVYEEARKQGAPSNYNNDNGKLIGWNNYNGLRKVNKKSVRTK